MTTWCMWVCGSISLVDYFNVRTHDIWEKNVTTRRDIWIENIRFLGFRHITEGVTLWRLTLHRLGCCNNIWWGHRGNYLMMYVTWSLMPNRGLFFPLVPILNPWTCKMGILEGYCCSNIVISLNRCLFHVGSTKGRLAKENTCYSHIYILHKESSDE
jgi:hypothetical protein